MEALTSPLRSSGWFSRLDAIKVTGSNGKGSVSAMCAAILRAFGVETGLYTSPHLVRFHERMSIDGQPIGDAELERWVDWFWAEREAYERHYPGDRIGAFEAFTAIALRWLESRRPETVVAEAGIGGRYDPVRFFPGSLVGLTSLDLEHTEFLGPSLELIAYNKADLCPEGGELVLGALEPEVLRRLEAYCRLRQVRVVHAEAAMRPVAIRYAKGKMIVDFATEGGRLDEVEIALLGQHQATNAAVAATLVRRWLKVHRPEMPEGEIEAGLRRGLASVEWPGRLEKVSEDPEVYVDAGHSPGAIAALVEAVRGVLPERRILLVVGVSRDKPVEAIVAQLLPLAERVICTRAYHKGADPRSIEEIVRRLRPDLPLAVEERIEDAMARALEDARREDLTVLVAGGLFLSQEAAEVVRGRDPRALRFF
jgi:dihydrofolate synthase/folylpolyglutamate synthase